MIRIATLSSVLFMAFAACRLLACTAQSVIDDARKAKATPQYSAAREVAEEVITRSKYQVHENTLDAGIGTLLHEKERGTRVSNGGASASDWRKILETRSAEKHGISKWGERYDETLMSLPENYTKQVLVEDHMRLHISEWNNKKPAGTPAPSVVEGPPPPAPTATATPAPAAPAAAPAPPAPSIVEGAPPTSISFPFPFPKKTATAPKPATPTPPTPAPVSTPVSIPEPALPLEHFAG